MNHYFDNDGWLIKNSEKHGLVYPLFFFQENCVAIAEIKIENLSDELERKLNSQNYKRINKTDLHVKDGQARIRLECLDLTGIDAITIKMICEHDFELDNELVREIEREIERKEIDSETAPGFGPKKSNIF